MSYCPLSGPNQLFVLIPCSYVTRIPWNQSSSFLCKSVILVLFTSLKIRVFAHNGTPILVMCETGKQVDSLILLH